MRIGKAVDIITPFGTFRYSTRPFERTVEDESGDYIPLVYLPYIVTSPNVKSQTDFDFSLKRESLKFSVWDVDRDLSSLYGKFDYETTQINLYLFDGEDHIYSEMSGYLTDYSFRDGTSDFTVRFEENIDVNKLYKRFSFDTFQKVELLRPAKVKLGSTFNTNTNTPWQVLKTSIRGSTLANQRITWVNHPDVLALSGWSSDKIYRDNPGGLPQDSEAPVIRLNIRDNLYDTFDLVDCYFLKVGSIVDSFNYQVKLGATTYTHNSGVGATEESILRGISTQLSGGGVTNNFLQDTQRLYIEGNPTVLDASITTFSQGYLQFFFDSNTPGSTQILRRKQSVLFPTTPINTMEGRPFIRTDGEDMEYFYAVVGNSQNLDSKGNEVIAYLYCTKGMYYHPFAGGGGTGGFVETNDGNVYLSGIPSFTGAAGSSAKNPGGLAALTAVGVDYPDVVSVDDLADIMGVKYRHSQGEFVAPLGAKDKLYVTANGLSVISKDDPQLGAGFIHVGGQINASVTLNPASVTVNKAYLMFHRYKMTGILYNVYDDNRNDGIIHGEVFELEIHNRNPNLDPSHDYYLPVRQGLYELTSAQVNIDSKVLLGEFVSTVEYIDFFLDGLNSSVFGKISAVDNIHREALRDRYRGLRVDMLRDVEQYRQVVDRGIQYNTQELQSNDISQFNARIINNSDGLFAVCVSSEIINENSRPFFERLYFSYEPPDRIRRSFVPADVVENNLDVEDTTYQRSFDQRSRNYYVNYLTYKPLQVSLERFMEVNENLQESVEFFSRGSYRVIHDPVPENSDDLGKIFPVVYGVVDKVPVLHCVSKKNFTSKDSSAGDDVYIYASHPCDVKEPTDINIFIEERNVDPDVEDQEFEANLKFHIIQTPFPKVVNDHFKVEQTSDAFFPKIYFAGTLNSPYHHTRSFRTIDDEYIFGFKLSGNEWNPLAGTLDKRYPIRNGVGSSKLYASFGGWIDQDGSITGRSGQLIQHPADVIHHFMKYYGTFPINESVLNVTNLLKLKQQTRSYKMAVFINEPLTAGAFIEQICKQCFILPYYYNDGVRFSSPRLSDVQYDKHIQDELNLLESAEESSSGYKDIHNEIVYRYKFFHQANRFDKEIVLNASNNDFCARASRVLSAKKTLTIDANWVNDDSTAIKVANQYARFMSTRRRTFTVRVKRGVRYEPSDVTLLSSRELKVENLKVVVMSVDEGNDSTQLELISFEEI